MKDKFSRQNEQYVFPYHYLPHFVADGVPLTGRVLPWGLEYLCYLSYIVAEVQRLSPASILDVGCGDGRFLGMLDDSIGERLGIDLSARAIGFARAFHPQIDYRCTALSEIKKKFALVTVIEVLEHIPDDQLTNFIMELSGRVESSGRLLVSVPTTVLPVNPKHYRHYTIDLLQKQLRCAPFELLKADYIYRDHHFFELLLRLFNNRWWTLNSRVARRCLWRLLQKRIARATRDDGRHLVALFQKGES
ncbi:MAG: hypothetical protein DRH03_05410 [Deltaproteobacteria bacterium]|nr:MAG: hypothetical protein DRH03_05410 [Deltaproteobacteria bacterium]